MTSRIIRIAFATVALTHDYAAELVANQITGEDDGPVCELVIKAIASALTKTVDVLSR